MRGLARIVGFLAAWLSNRCVRGDDDCEGPEMNLQVGGKLFQVIWWGWRWNVGYWRWPNLRTQQDIERVTGRKVKFGFYGLYIGPVEFRFHPHRRHT